MPMSVNSQEIVQAFAAVASELTYQDQLPRRTDDEAKDVPGFLTLLRRYVRQTEDAWADKGGETQPNGAVQVPEALDGLRKIAAIAVRGMIYNGMRDHS